MRMTNIDPNFYMPSVSIYEKSAIYIIVRYINSLYFVLKE